MLSHRRLPTVAAAALVLTFVAPAHADFEVIEAYTATDSGGLTRDSLSDGNLAQTRSAGTASGHTAQRRRTRNRSGNYSSARSHHHRRHGGRHGGSAVAAKSRPKRRGPVAGFVYWWNGWVIRTFHTKFGTVMLGTIGAKS